jgi:S1-C subfamily serine protease
MEHPLKYVMTAALAASALTIALPALAQQHELTEQRRIDVARRLQESTVSVIAGPSTGSGFVVGEERWILTNSHVIRPGRQYGVRVHFASGTMMQASVLVDSPEQDLAVLRVEGAVPSRPLALGDSDQVVVGQTVLAFGSPFGLEGTLTQGIVSAVRDVPPGTALGGGSISRLIQTDAPINPGNSGGPLVNSRGEVIGINTAILSRTGGSHGIGFAIPSSYVRALLQDVRQQLREGGRVGRAREPADATGGAFLGILGDDFREGRVSGVRIRQVVPGSPAETAGLAGSDDAAPLAILQLGVPWTGHIILAVDGRRVRTMRELSTMLERRRPGERAVLTITVGPGVMSGEAVVTLSERPPPSAQ